MNKITNYIKEVRSEMSQVSWPTRETTVTVTIAVIAISLVVGYLLSIFDFGFSRLIKFLIS